MHLFRALTTSSNVPWDHHINTIHHVNISFFIVDEPRSIVRVHWYLLLGIGINLGSTLGFKAKVDSSSPALFRLGLPGLGNKLGISHLYKLNVCIQLRYA